MDEIKYHEYKESWKSREIDRESFSSLRLIVGCDVVVIVGGVDADDDDLFHIYSPFIPQKCTEWCCLVGETEKQRRLLYYEIDFAICCSWEAPNNDGIVETVIFQTWLNCIPKQNMSDYLIESLCARSTSSVGQIGRDRVE